MLYVAYFEVFMDCKSRCEEYWLSWNELSLSSALNGSCDNSISVCTFVDVSFSLSLLFFKYVMLFFYRRMIKFCII